MMSTFFPKLPKVTGDTDDDISIHLYNTVGPAKPLNKRKDTLYENEIIQILNEEVDENDDQVLNFNQKFREFQETGKIDDTSNYLGDTNDYDDYDGVGDDEEDTEVEEDNNDLASFKQQINRSPRERQASHQEGQDNDGTPVSSDAPSPSSPTSTQFGTLKWFSKGSITFVVIALIFYLSLFLYVAQSNNSPISGLPSNISSSFKSISTRINKLEVKTDLLTERQAALESNQNSMATSLNKKFDLVSKKFLEFENLNINSKNIEHLFEEFKLLKISISSMLDNTDTKHLEEKLTDVTTKLNKLTSINDNIEQTKDEILAKLIDQLPDRIPVYIKDKKVHFIPEFLEFLYSFIEKFEQENPIWERRGFNEKFASSVANEVKKSIVAGNNSVIGTPSSISKDKLELFLKKKFDENNNIIWDKLTNFIDGLTLTLNGTSVTDSDTKKLFEKTTNQILLDDLLSTLSKGSVKINYADYKLGARILGFLTKLGKEEAEVSLTWKLFFGWYEYLKGPKTWNYNANTLLVNGGSVWECLSNVCSVGIRLFNPVIVTDIIVQGSVQGTASQTVSTPTEITVYIKPKNHNQAETVLKQLSEFRNTASSGSSSSSVGENKYLKKFIKVKTYKLDPSKSLNILKFPVTLINLKAPVRDIYLELKCDEGRTCGLYSVNVYGITEYNSQKFTHDMELLFDNIHNSQKDEEEAVTESSFDKSNNPYIYEQELLGDLESSVLGSDELIL